MKCRILNRISFLLLLVTATAVHAAPEHQAKAFTVSPMAGFFAFDGSRDFDNNANYALGLGYNVTRHWSGEFFFNYTNTERSDENTNYFLWHVDGLYHFNKRAQRFVPYAVSGLGMSRELSDAAKNETRVSWNVGGGAKYFITDYFGLRVDARMLYEPHDHDVDGLFTGGVVFQFGGEPAPRAVHAAYRYCVNVPDDYLVDEWGCPLYQEKEVGFDLAIFFDFDEDQIKPEYEDELRRMAAFLEHYPDLAGIVLEGYADNTGLASYNQELSEQRAENVREALIEEYGIAPERIDILGFGITNPLADNTTEEGRAQNRRVVTSIRTVEHIEVAKREARQFRGRG